MKGSLSSFFSTDYYYCCYYYSRDERKGKKSKKVECNKADKEVEISLYNWWKPFFFSFLKNTLSSNNLLLSLSHYDHLQKFQIPSFNFFCCLLPRKEGVFSGRRFAVGIRGFHWDILLGLHSELQHWVWGCVSRYTYSA